MKELTIEQKARAYDEALERAMKFLNKELFAENSECAIKHIFPELAESEDERIRKMLIDSFTRADMGGEIYGKGVTYKQVIAWLEKQGEQKPAKTVKWSPQEESCICQLESLVKEQWRHAEKVNNAVDIKKMQDLMFFLKTLNPNKKPQRMISAEAKEAMYGKSAYAWNEEDEEMLRSIMATCELAEQERDSSPAKHLLQMQLNWLKSLKLKATWKPSDEQMEALFVLLPTVCNGNPAFSLYNNLKKLKGE